MERHVVVGAGPAGLTAAWHLARLGEEVCVLEADPERVGGLACTMELEGHRYDVGPHRFYTKSDEVLRLWETMLPGGFVEVRRLTRVLYRRKLFAYPLELRKTLAGIGPREALLSGASFARARLLPRREASFEDWVINRFGERLYRAFFKTYTEKVWGVPCDEIDKDWAAQRIRDLSLGKIVRQALVPARNGARPKSLVDRFRYPRRGAGELWEAVLDDVLSRDGSRIEMGSPVVRLVREGRRVVAAETADGRAHEGTRFYLTMTLSDFVAALDPPPPPAVVAAGRGLAHRDFLVVALIAERAGLFPDQWIYVHDPEVRVARVTCYANWSAAMSPGPSTTALGLEYFCGRGDALWNRPDGELVALAREELERIGFSADGPGRVHRFRDAYPVYDGRYRERRALLQRWIGTELDNVQPAGRKGLHNYNSQDHAMMTATLAVRNALEGAAFDAWAVNTDREYAEEGSAREELEERLVPLRAR